MDLKKLQDKATKYLRAYDGFKDVVVSVESDDKVHATLYLENHDFFIQVSFGLNGIFEPGYVKHFYSASYNDPTEWDLVPLNSDNDSCSSLAEACAILVKADYLNRLQSFDEEELTR